MTIIGITGGIGSGKSTVSKIFNLLGIPVYIADIESKKLTETSPTIKRKLTDAFGKDLYIENKLNKQLLASYIFSSKQNLKIANSIIHPEVNLDFTYWVKKHNYYPILAMESAILYESRMEHLVDKVIMVYTPLEERIKRVMARDNSSREKILQRINSQTPDEEKARIADHIIQNDESQSLIVQSLEILQKYD